MKKKLISKVLAIAMALCMVFTIIPSMTFAETNANGSTLIDSGTCGENLTWTLNEDGTFTISGKGEMESYRSEYVPWHKKTKLIKKVVIEEGVTSIANYSFYSCYYLENVSLPTGLKSIGDFAFRYTNITNIILPNTLISIGEEAFDGSLDNIYLPLSLLCLGRNFICDGYSSPETCVFYEGSHLDWDKITKEHNLLDEDEIHFETKEHSWSEWKFQNWDCENACSGGIMERQCNVCGKEETKKVQPQPHNYIAKVNKQGVLSIPKCNVCHEEYYVSEGHEEWDKWHKKNEWLYDFETGECIIKPVLSQTKFTADGTDNIPTVVVYIYLYDFDSYICKYTLNKKYYDITYSSDGKKAGTHNVTISLKGKYSGELSLKYTVSASPMNTKTLDLYKGKNYNLKIKGTNGTITWSSTNKNVAIVSSSGKVTAKNYGTCTIKANFKGKTYKCKVTIPHHKPKIYGEISSYSTRSNIVTVYIQNDGKAPVTIYSGGSKLIDWDYTSYDRTLKLVNGNSTTIKAGQGKYIKYKVLGSTTWPGVDRKDIRIKLKYDGKKYTRYISN